MQKLKHLLLTAAMLLCSLLASAHDFEVGGIYYNITSNTDLTVAVTYRDDNYASYTDRYSGTVTIPSSITYNGTMYRVTSLGSYAFCYCGSLTAITIPTSVTVIGESAFYGCSSLTAVHISNLEAWCNIDFDGYDANPLYCAKNLYLNGELVTELTIPNTVTAIKNFAFSYCRNLTSISISEGVTSIGECAFAWCGSPTSVTIPNSVTSIGSRAFAYCNLTSISISEGVTSIGESAFSGCSNLTSITLPEGSQLMNIGDEAFYDCSSLASITIPESVTSIGNYAFSGCSNLTSITLPESSQLMSIGNAAFYWCQSLTSITIPVSVTSIGSAAFGGCSSLTAVYCYAEEVPTTYTDAFNASYPKYATLHVPASALEAYKTTAPWNSFGTIVALTEEEMSVEQTIIEEQYEIYDLNGRCVETPGKGIYIVNGIKVVIK